MSERAEDLAQSLQGVQDAIDDINDAIHDANGGREYEDLIGIKVSLLADRQAIVEQLEALGLEDPDL